MKASDDQNKERSFYSNMLMLNYTLKILLCVNEIAQSAILIIIEIVMQDKI